MIKVFDDWKSIIHFLYGIFVSFILFLCPPAGLFLLFIFIIYEIGEKEPLENKIGDFIEFGLGLFIGVVFILFLNI